MKDRRKFLWAVACLAISTPLTTSAQIGGNPRRIGYLTPFAPETAAELQQAFPSLRKLGWIEGRNLIFERRYAHNRPERLRSLAEELVRLKVELIVTEGTAATLAAKSATNTIPIVFLSAGDPVAAGLVASFARPGGNVTGYTIVSPELDAKRLAVLRELSPTVQRVGVLENSTNPYFRAARRAVEHACQSLGIQPIFVEAAVAGELENAVAEVVRQGGQGLLIPPDSLFYEHRSDIMRAALAHALPTTVSRLYIREFGALISYAPMESEYEDRGAAFIDRILRGASPANLPVEQPTKFQLIINLKTAKALAITIPAILLSRADEIIE